jgi:hypothetical protein
MSYQAIRDKNGRVGVKYKGAGSHYNFSHSDIDKQHGHKPYLAHPLHALLSHVGKVLPKGHGEYQGGFMSTPETRATSGGKISHTPNTLKYETDAKSEEGKKLKKSKISTVIHTKIDAEGRAHPITESISITEAKGFGSHPDVHQVDHIVGKDERKLSPEHQKAVDHHVGEAEKLMKRLKVEHGQHKLNAKWRLSEDAAPKLDSYRAYLHALDCEMNLVGKAIADGKTAKDVKLVEVLGALRLFYIKKHERYKGKGDAMPYRLMHGDGGYETDPTKIVVSDHAHPKVATQSINAVRDYLKKGNEILERVSRGQFP